MGEEWGINIKSYAAKIKKAFEAGIEKEFIIQTKGKGMNGRFTVPGLKAKKKRKKNALTKKFDEDEVEYVAPKTQRDEARERAEQELEERRQEIKSEEVRKELEKASRPKKPAPPKKTEWEVEMITKMKVRIFSCLDHTFPAYLFNQLYMQEIGNLNITSLVQ